MKPWHSRLNLANRIDKIINELKERSIVEICHRIKKSSDAQYVVVQSTNW
jgi:hypothetical protein